MNTQLKEITRVWPDIQGILSVPDNEEDYQKLVNLLDGLIDEVGNDEAHHLSSLVETIGSLIETYEFHNIPCMEGNPIDALKFLTEEHGLKQSDLPEIGSQGVVSEIMTGKRKLNVRHIKLLSKRFKVSPAVLLTLSLIFLCYHLCQAFLYRPCLTRWAFSSIPSNVPSDYPTLAYFFHVILDEFLYTYKEVVSRQTRFWAV